MRGASRSGKRTADLCGPTMQLEELTMEQNIDPVLGPLAFRAVENGQGWWTRQEHLDLMGGTVPLEVHAATGDPTEVERQIYRTFKQAEKGLRAELQAALYAFYQIQRKQYADACGDIEGYIDNFLPELQRPEEVWGILTPLSWLILGPKTAFYQYDELDGECEVLLSWHGCWDIEHEFSALFGGGRFLGIEALDSFYSPAHLQSFTE